VIAWATNPVCKDEPHPRPALAAAGAPTMCSPRTVVSKLTTASDSCPSADPGDEIRLQEGVAADVDAVAGAEQQVLHDALAASSRPIRSRLPAAARS